MNSLQTTTDETTREQLRATCPACFATQAVRSGRMSQHGYRRPQQWHSNVGTCSGAGRSHFGTAAGRDYTSTLATQLRAHADRTETTAAGVLAGTESVMGRKRIGRGVDMAVVVENPTDAQRSTYARVLRDNAVAMRASADEFDARVATWKPVEPVAVTVEAKRAPLVHLRGSYYSTSGKACAASAMAAQKWAATTSNVAEVTCDKCIAHLARRAAKAAAKGGQQ